VISGMDKMLRRVVREDVFIEVRSTGALDKVKADRGQIEQVMMNLVVNASDAMPAGGKIVIETANVELDEARAKEQLGAKAGPHVMITVTDTGSGMDRETRARIFEPFFTTKAPGKGTGLGLATVFGIVQRYDGSTWVYSELGRGTTFKVFFPSYERAEGARDTRRFTVPPPRVLRGSETVLLVEDEAPVRGVAGAILRKSGYHVLEASDAGEALQICEGRDTPIHLLLADVVMPHASGAELAERARASHPDMRVLFMSGDAPESIIGRGGVDSNVAFLQKPLTPDVLSRKVRDVLDT
jgi:two-component system cell cycle sensor histidine kinase/response regulator CckA